MLWVVRWFKPAPNPTQQFALNTLNQAHEGECPQPSGTPVVVANINLAGAGPSYLAKSKLIVAIHHHALLVSSDDSLERLLYYE